MLLIDTATFASISRQARRDDPRLEWGETGLDRLFGFRPEIVEAEPTRFTSLSKPASCGRRTERFTLGELRAL